MCDVDDMAKRNNEIASAQSMAGKRGEASEKREQGVTRGTRAENISKHNALSTKQRTEGGGTLGQTNGAANDRNKNVPNPARHACYSRDILGPVPLSPRHHLAP